MSARYTWTAPNGTWVESCKPQREDEWIAGGTLCFLRHAYAHIFRVVYWHEPRRDLRIWLANRGVTGRAGCRVAGHVYAHMTGVCYCGERKGGK